MRSQYNKVNYVLYEHRQSKPPKKNPPQKKFGTQMEKELSQTEILRAYFRNLNILILT